MWLPAAAPVRAGLTGLHGILPRVLTLVQPPLDDGEGGDEHGEEHDHAEHDVGDLLVVGLAEPALTAVGVGEGRRRERQQEDDERRQSDHEAGAPHGQKRTASGCQPTGTRWGAATAVSAEIRAGLYVSARSVTSR